MIVTTTQSIDGYKITGYYGIVFGEVITGIKFLRISAQVFATLLVVVAKGMKMNSLAHAMKLFRNLNNVPPKWALMRLWESTWITKFLAKATC